MFIVEQIIIYVLLTVALIANLIAEARDSEMGKYYTKPLLIPLILAFYLIMGRETSVFIVLALSFALFGDIFLLFEHHNLSFRMGILSFLLSHLCWISYIIFSLDLPGIPLPRILRHVIPAFVPAIVGCFLFWKYLYNIRVISILYMFTGSSLLYFCLLRFGYVPNRFAWYAIAGCFLLFISDFMIIWSRFKQEFKYSGVYIMLSYVFAMIFLVIGFMNPPVK